jgi:GT2 family glycosyltransferase
MNKARWSEAEDTLLILYYPLYQNHWSKYHHILPGRSEVAIYRRMRFIRKEFDQLEAFFAPEEEKVEEVEEKS